MSIEFSCSCGKRLKVKDGSEGRVATCPDCAQKIRVPGTPAAGRPAATVSSSAAAPIKSPVPTTSSLSSAAATPSSLPPLHVKTPPIWMRHLHWLLVLALIPLAVSLMSASDADDVEQRLIATIRDLAESQKSKSATLPGAPVEGQPGFNGEQAPMPGGPAPGPQVQPELMPAAEEDPFEGFTFEDLFQIMPGHKIQGAWLSRDTYMHWLFALISAACFLTFFALLASDKSSFVKHLLLIGIFTATVGIFLLLAFQFMAGATQGVWVRGRGALTLLFYIVKFIGFSYSAALDPETGFLLSFLGFTCGVGLCEELCKAMPLMWYYRQENKQTWRGAFQWGLASGAGFGIAEAVMYSGNYYNGIHGPGIYLVRFVSCVALHALWSGSVGISIYKRREELRATDDWGNYLLYILLAIAVPMVLHGLYDTLLKKEMNELALVVAFASFGYLAVQIVRIRGEDDAVAEDDMMRQYELRKRLAAAR